MFLWLYYRFIGQVLQNVLICCLTYYVAHSILETSDQVAGESILSLYCILGTEQTYSLTLLLKTILLYLQ